MENIDEMSEFEPYFADGKCNIYTISEASKRSLCRALMELQCAYQMISDIDDAGMQPTERAAKAVQTAKEILSEVKQLSQEDSEKVSNAKEIAEKLCGEDILRLTPDQAAIIDTYVQQAWYRISETSILAGKVSDNYDNYNSSDTEYYRLKRCKDELSLAATLLETIRDSGSIPIVRLRCAIRIAEKMLESVDDLNEKDHHVISEIAKFLSILPEPLSLIECGKGKQFRNAIAKAARYLVCCIQHVFDDASYDDMYYTVLFDFLDYPKTEEYKAEIRKELSKN